MSTVDFPEVIYRAKQSIVKIVNNDNNKNERSMGRVCGGGRLMGKGGGERKGGEREEGRDIVVGGIGVGYVVCFY